MKVTLENTICEWDNDTAAVIIKFINLIMLAKTRRELEVALDFTPFKSLYLKHLTWGWGSRHLWVKQVCPFNEQVMENRLMIVEF